MPIARTGGDPNPGPRTLPLPGLVPRPSDAACNAVRERSRRPMQMAMNLVSFRVTHRPGSGNSHGPVIWQMILVDRTDKGTYEKRLSTK
jgi:hypothetical protein